MNPLAKALMFLGFIVSGALLFWFIILKPVKYPRFPKFRKFVLVKKDGVVTAQFTINFKGARRVIFADKKQPQDFFNRMFTGRIDTVVNPVFNEPITFIPRKRKNAMARGNGYLFNQNPIPQSGTTEITNPSKKLIISLK